LAWSDEALWALAERLHAAAGLGFGFGVTFFCQPQHTT